MLSLDFLETVEAFQNISDDQLLALKQCGQKAVLKKGEMLFTEGEESEAVWIVMEGKVGLKYDLPRSTVSIRNSVSFISEPQVFGWSCFVPPYKYRMSAYCTTRTCEAFKMNKEQLIQLFADDAEIGYSIMTYLTTIVGVHFDRFQDELAKRMGDEIISKW
jgi:CRP-like cAMP-binding protein